eukprot:6092827-Pleurochrysis_carterae.AAC.1
MSDAMLEIQLSLNALEPRTEEGFGTRRHKNIHFRPSLSDTAILDLMTHDAIPSELILTPGETNASHRQACVDSVKGAKAVKDERCKFEKDSSSCTCPNQ